MYDSFCIWLNERYYKTIPTLQVCRTVSIMGRLSDSFQNIHHTTMWYDHISSCNGLVPLSIVSIPHNSIQPPTTTTIIQQCTPPPPINHHHHHHLQNNQNGRRPLSPPHRISLSLLPHWQNLFCHLTQWPICRGCTCY